MAKVELEGKLRSGFPAMTATVRVHKRSQTSAAEMDCREPYSCHVGLRCEPSSGLSQRITSKGSCSVPWEMVTPGKKNSRAYPGHRQIEST